MSRKDENMFQQVSRMEEDVSVKPPASKRAALSTLNNHQPRVQPFRAAKANNQNNNNNNNNSKRQNISNSGLTTRSQQQQQQQITSASNNNNNNNYGNKRDGRAAPFQIYQSPTAMEEKNIKPVIVVNREKFQSPLNPIVSALPPPAPIGLESMMVDDSPFAPPSELRRNTTTTTTTTTNDDKTIVADSIFIKNECIKEEKSRELCFSVDFFALDIIKHLKVSEISYAPRVDYIAKQPDITNSMRLILIDWLVEVAEEYKMKRETLCLTINYVDRFLSVMSVFRTKLQLVGAAAMFIASKYEEIYPPDVNEFVYITDDTYTKAQVLKMEQLILKTLQFQLVAPTSNFFAEFYCNRFKILHRSNSLIMYFVELSSLDGDVFLKYKMSHIAAASVYLMGIIFDELDELKNFDFITGYSSSDLRNCMTDLYRFMCIAPDMSQKAVYEKYKTEKFHAVSKISPPSSLFGLERIKLLRELKNNNINGGNK